MGQAVRELLDREVPDVLILAVPLPDAAGEAVARMVRQDPRFRLLPILMLGRDTVADRIAGLRAGVNDFLAYPADAGVVTQTVITRAERGRRLRELLHRDELTGLLNATTLMAELEHAVDHCRRHGGPLAFVVFDLDRFPRSERAVRHPGGRPGPAPRGQRLPLERARQRCHREVRRRRIRDDTAGGGSEGASVLAEKLRTVLGRQSATTHEGKPIAVKVSVGWAGFPTDGGTAGELAHAAGEEPEEGKAGNGERGSANRNKMKTGNGLTTRSPFPVSLPSSV